VPSAVQTQDPKTKMSSRLKVTVSLIKIEAVEFAMRSLVSPPAWRTSYRSFGLATYQGEYLR
jgi:hypothetical protein